MKKYVLLFLSLLIIAGAYAQEDAFTPELKLNIPKGHTDDVSSVEFSANGKFIVTASYDHTAILWDVENQNTLYILEGHTSIVNSAKFSPNSKSILTSSNDNTARIWNEETGKLLHILKGHTKRVMSATFSPDGETIITASWDNTAKLWNAKTGKLLRTLNGHSNMVNSAMFNQNGKIIVTASADSTAKLWNTENGKLFHTLEGHTGNVNFAKFNQDGSIVLTASVDGTVRIWDVESGNILSVLKTYDTDVSAAAFSPDGRIVIAESYDKAFLWNVENGKLLHTLKGHSGRIMSALFAPDSKSVVTASTDDTAILWDVQTGKLLHTLKGHSTLVDVPAIYSPDGEAVVTISKNYTVSIWDAKSAKLKSTLEGHANRINSAVFSPDNKVFVTAHTDKTARIWDIKSGKLLHALKGHELEVKLASFSPDGKTAITVSGYSARLWDVKSGKLLHWLRGHTNWVKYAIFSEDGKTTATASDDNTVKLWDVESGKLLHTLEGHTKRIKSIIFSPDGRTIITISFDYRIGIWDVKTGKPKLTISTYPLLVLSSVFSPDSKTVVFSLSDHTVRIWDVGKGKELSILQGHTNWVNSAMFSPKGEIILTASNDSTARLWDIKSGNTLHTFKGQTDKVKSATFNMDGTILATVSKDNNVRLWNVENGDLLSNYKLNGTIEAIDLQDNRLLYNFNSVITLFDLMSGEDLYSILAIDSAQYLNYDQHHRFDGTENARKSLYFTCGLDVIKLEQVKDQLWVPNLAERIMKGESINSPKLEDLDLCNLIPEVETLETNNNIYSFIIKPRRGGLGESVLYVNNLEVKRYSTGQLIKEDGEFLLQVPAREVEPYFLAGEKNTVSVKAYTADNAIISRGAETLSEENNLKKQPPEIYAVVVGVSDYKGEELDLRYPAKDAKKISAILESSSSKLFSYDGLDRVHLYLLQTDADRSAFPDKKSIKDTFTKIGKTAKSNDVLLIFFAGHGEVNKNDQQFYFLTADASVNSLPETVGISTKELFEWINLNNIKAQNRVLILDACNSGQAIKDIIKNGDDDHEILAARDNEYAYYKKELDKLNDKTGLFILSASASTQSAYEMNTYNQGILTYALLKPLKENPNILDANNLLSVSSWFEAAEDVVDDISTTYEFRQDPQLYSTTNFKIGVVDDEVRSKIVLPREKPIFGATKFLDVNVPIDKIGLSEVFNSELIDMAYQNTEGLINYFPNSDSSESTQLSGNYRVSGEKITINIYMSKNNRTIARFERSGTKSNLEELAKQVIEEAISRLNQ